ncbi:nascent polypeptide-associated complex subunit alpha, muscle-specific form [Drosophila ananassae]|uniref:nascent polypeptide-associated complex subunit alpha, muscle-specific form n=1 Tax=Drosophila ananassae TaxID=7217 RepID=UPI0013A5DA64|nr:nascent polypeptide-associated complex subunit alpha, muscle-specific form [Drosophila ananassae]
MEPNRHHEYQTHHQPHPSMQNHPHHVPPTSAPPPHHQPPIHQHPHHPPPPGPPGSQQPPGQAIHHPHHYQQLHHQQHLPTSSNTVVVGSSSSAGYGSLQHLPGGLGEDQRSRTAMYMSRSTPTQAVPPQGQGSAPPPTGGDPHLQYYTSNRDLTVNKMPEASHPNWSYKTQTVPAPAPAPAPALRHHGNPAIYPTGRTAYWPPAEEQLHHHQPPARYSYGKPPTGSGTIPLPAARSASQRYYPEDIKYSTVPVPSKVLSYASTASSQPGVAPPTASSSANPSSAAVASTSVRQHHYELEHVVNPSNPSNEHQQPSPNYGRKCPPHYETPPEQRSAGATPTSSGTPTSTSAHHQSLYMPMPQFSTEKFQTTVNNAIEKYVRETPGPSLEYPRGGSGAANYGRTASTTYYNPTSSGKSSKAPPASYVKLEPEHALPGSLPQPTRSSLYHNPYSAESTSSSRERDASPAMATVPAPHGYPTKYGKLIQQVGTASSTPYSSYYHQGTPSPAAGAVASPTPAPPAPPVTGAPPGTILPGSGPLPPQSAPSQQPASSSTASSSSSANYSTLQVYPHGPDICYQPGGAPSQAQSHPAATPAKKPPAKPNYRALINDMLKRNTASEQELNLQIIKKTLNMEAPARNHLHHPTAPSRVIQQATASAPVPVPVAVPVAVPAANPPPALHSPLDLSMRTVKQTADSTDYKYRSPSATEYKPSPGSLSGGGAAGGLGLPRFDFTPNFSAASRGQPPTSPAPTPVIRQAPSTASVSPAPLPHHHHHPAAAPPAPAAAPALVIKTLQQMRPSVLETNPYAKRQQLPPETSIVQVSKPPELMPTPSPSPHNSSNPNYLGRKRHLKEYNQAAAKQARLEAESSVGVVPPIVAAPTSVVVVAPVPVIAVNEQALAAKRERETQPQGLPESTSSSTSSASSTTIPKMEPRIRTKAELKGFTFTPPVLVTSTTNANATGAVSPPRTPPNQVTNHIQIKLEPAPPPPPKSADLGLEEERASLGNLLDWGSTCNNLVEQLLNKAVVLPPMPPMPPLPTTTTSIKLELSEDDLPVARILKRQPLATPTATATVGADAESASTQLTTTTNGISSSLGNGSGQKKLSKVEREKKRQQQEQRIAARLAPKEGQSSSSESDTTELHKRKTARQKKPLMRKGRARQRSPEAASSQQSSDDEKGKADCSQGVSRSQSSSGESKSKGNSSKKDLKKVKEAKSNSLAKTSNNKNKTKAEDNQKQQDSSNSNSESHDDEEEEEEEEEDAEEEEDDEDQEEEDKEGTDEDAEAEKKPVKRVGRRPGATLKKRIAHNLNTMTRSKHRKELELQLANSKVLRNDKIIRNSTTKIKRKYVRKVVDSKKEMMVTRLRNKRGPNSEAGQLNGRNSKLKMGNKGGGNNKSAKTSPQQQLYLEEYRYKLALKIPHRLISINKLNKGAASLPDLERRDLGQELACFKKTRPKTKAASKQESIPKSFIDYLVLRVTNGNSNSSPPVHGNSRKISVSAPASTNLQIHSETSQTSASTSLYEQPQQEAPGSESQNLDDPSRRHFSIFDTKVLQSKTRTESKLQQRREIIREIFVGPERPASAPPECAQEADGDAISYQKYEEFLQQMNSIVSGSDNKLARRSLMEDKALNSTAPQCPHKRKYLRRKGSSGFDYIRKKKRPTTAQNQNQNHGDKSSQAQTSSQLAQAHLSADERLEDTDSTIAGSSHLPTKIKTEMDVYREFQKWVLNKSVGQSTMHKAARQGLIDVVVYCLDRLNMNPDQKDNAGYTPLHEACTQGWLEIARILLQYGANHSEAAQSGIRPLHGAIENDHEEVVRLLLSYGADPLLATYSGQTPLMLASSKLMRRILRAHLSDAQSAAADIKPMRFQGPWEIFDAKEYGYDIFDNVPNTACDMSRALRRERKEAKQQDISMSNMGSTISILSNGNITSNHSNGNGVIPIKMKMEPAQDAEMMQDQNDGESRVTTIKQNGETSAIKTGTLATTGVTTGPTTMVKLEPGTEEEDSNNNKNNDELNANVGNNLVTSVVNVKNEVKREVDAEPEPQPEPEAEAETVTETGTQIQPSLPQQQTQTNSNNRSNRIDDDQADIETMDMDSELNGDIFEFEEADVPLPPLYLLKDEGSDKWVLLNDLCNLLKVKSKDTLLNKLCPNNNNALASSQKHLLREFKIDDFLEKATCLQLLCAGEKLNMFSSSKVVLIKYNESVRNLLGVKTILMKF